MRKDVTKWLEISNFNLLNVSRVIVFQMGKLAFSAARAQNSSFAYINNLNKTMQQNDDAREKPINASILIFFFVV